MSEKTEQPTDKRLRDAREEGQVAKSQDIGATVQLAVILLWMVTEGPRMYAAIGGFIDATLATVNLPLLDAMTLLTGEAATLMIRFVFGLAMLLIVTLILTGLVETGFLFAPKAIMPSAERISPLSNAKQMVSLLKLFELGKMILKIVILGLTFTYFIRSYAESFAQLVRADAEAGLWVTSKMILWLWGILLLLTALFAVVDYSMQYRHLRKQLMMSREDIKQEFKNSEGSPEIKQRRRELHREIQSGSLADSVASASVVVRNPTHIAVCLRYCEGETPLPQVVEYGRGARAQHIVTLAEALRIPVVENIPLARALIATTRPGDYVPEELFAAVAQLLRLLRDDTQEEENDE
ncbi:EscU/YscU/HrcU family type III secretion system export apparatus switch protein [Edwardsiella ictaluri]|uniref:Type III secretion protein, YscU/HrpY family n=3 Tax=Edwardsiella ictaluri TaxID=67780 RepID=C5B9S4_EDWI9|nr:EscU/YscU/HrcU family type III secretion system export apparatus switch protein [Edwardsiella ictaluri]AAT41686.1 type three secretion apparatus protein U [Edwardsiella ictaluri]ABC60087.1 EsaU [Edwardsiella ictaluri 93-146]ACR68176.1 type III secretion protein, YscU/HrpY family [Edwardsiella ictaluri 93-146]AVZ81436.1 EscU/YscU/HrcU family type III secretion system export apparatus switch protein [Edwardsiella ictaluri]EKS7764260.1 EscU/YscU/HrcU family type III secretion system export app